MFISIQCNLKLQIHLWLVYLHLFSPQEHKFHSHPRTTMCSHRGRGLGSGWEEWWLAVGILSVSSWGKEKGYLEPEVSNFLGVIWRTCSKWNLGGSNSSPKKCSPWLRCDFFGWERELLLCHYMNEKKVDVIHDLEPKNAKPKKIKVGSGFLVKNFFHWTSFSGDYIV